MLRQRKFIRIISYLIALCVVFSASGIFNSKAKADYESTLGKVRLESLVSLTEYSHEISSGLRILAVSTGDSLADSLSYVSARALGALGCLGCFDSGKAGNLVRFFSGVYDFSQSFSGDEEKRREAIRLSDYAQEVYFHLSDLTNAVVSGECTLAEHNSIYQRPDSPFFEDNLDFSNGAEEEIFGIITPAATKTKGSIFLSNKENISQGEAKKIASNITGISFALWRGEETQNPNGINIYSLTHGNTKVDICKSGGIICRIINPSACENAVYGIDEARKKAADFLKIHGFENMIETDSKKTLFEAETVFVPEINGVLLLPAIIEIDICLASGSVTYFDASEYICRYRTDIAYSKSKPDISGLLPEMLVLEKSFVCVADIDGRENLCVLAVCSFESDKVLVFIDFYSMKSIKTIIHK